MKQQELENTKTWFSSIIESAPDGMVVINSAGLITLINSKIQQLFGYEKKELLGLPIEILIGNEFRKDHVAKRNHFIQHGESREMGSSYAMEINGQRKDGSYFPVEVSLSHLPEIAEYGVCVCASIRDISKRREADAQIRVIEKHNQMILDSIDDGVIGIEVGGKIIFTNPAFLNLLGYDKG